MIRPMNMTAIILLLLLLASFCVVYGPGLVFSDAKSISLEEMLKLNPKYTNINWKFQFYGAIWSIIWGLALAAFALLAEDTGPRILYLLSAFWASAGVFTGIFAFRNGVYPAGGKFGVHFLYDSNEQHVQRVGMWQALLSLTLVIIAVSLFFLRLP